MATSMEGRPKRKPQIKWTRERLQFLREQYPIMSLRQLTAAFNDKYGVSVSEKAVGFQLSAHKITKKGEPVPR